MECGGSMSHSQGLSNKPYPESNQPNSLRSILILSSFYYCLSVNILKALLTSSILATWSACLDILDLITLNILGERYKLWSSSLWSLPYSSFRSLLNPNIRLRILFSNTISLHSSLIVRDHVSQPYSTTGNIIVLYILIIKFLEKSPEDSVWTE